MIAGANPESALENLNLILLFEMKKMAKGSNKKSAV